MIFSSDLLKKTYKRLVYRYVLFVSLIHFISSLLNYRHALVKHVYSSLHIDRVRICRYVLQSVSRRHKTVSRYDVKCV